MRRLLSQLLKNKHGNFALTTAIVLPVVIGAAGVAVDFNVGVTTKTDLQNALDAAVLSAASSGETDKDALRRLFDKTLAANLSRADATPTITQFKIDGKYITAQATMNVPLTFTRIFTDRPFNVAALSQAVAGNASLVDVALVLDNTYSMVGTKLADLKTASNKLLDVFENADTKRTQARFAVVPFSRYVNIGLNQRNKNWLTVANDTSTTKTENKCTKSKPIISQDCTKYTETRYNDGVPYTYTGSTCKNQVYGPEKTTCKDVTTTTSTKWSGCVYSRAETLDILDSDVVAKKYTGIMNQSCGSAIQPLTNDYKVLKAAIKAMVANDETFIAPGVLWGWNVLSPAAPFEEGLAYEPQNKKYMVIMTDGANTLSPAYKKSQAYTPHTAKVVATSDKLLLTTCANAKAAGVTVFTVGVGVTESGTADALASCATAPDMAFSVKNTTGLVDIFESIANKIMTPRLTM